MPRIPIAFSLAMLVLAWDPDAAAQESPAADDPRVLRARELFDEGVAHHEDGRYLLAAESFRFSYELMREAGRRNAGMLLFNLGSALEEIPGREREARDAYQRFLEEAPGDEAAVQERFTIVQARIRELDARLASAETGPSAPEPGGTESRISPVGPVSLGIGGGSMAAGVVIGALALNADEDIAASCPTLMDCPDSLRGQYDEMRAMALAADLLLFGGAAVAATGLILTLVLRESSNGVNASAACGPIGCRASFGGQF